MREAVLQVVEINLAPRRRPGIGLFMSRAASLRHTFIVSRAGTSPVKIGYPCINRSIGCRGNRTFRLGSYSEERLIATVRENLACLAETLSYNVRHNLLFFRMTSDLVPFASHPVCSVDWQTIFADELLQLGDYIRKNRLRISMHPDQFVVINAKDPGIVERSVRELAYHAALLDAAGLDTSAKVQIHIGGVYGDKERSLQRFIREYERLDERITRRLVIENDDGRYTVRDCLRVHEAVGIPVLFDRFHHEVNSSGETVRDAVGLAAKTWTESDGILMVDYSSQQPGGRRGTHAASLDSDHFALFLAESAPHDCDIMLEIKDKEQSALLAVSLAAGDGRFVRPPL